MLVLTRKQNEKIQIGDQITITVLRMKGKAVRLGIEAPIEMTEFQEQVHPARLLAKRFAVKEAAARPASRSSLGVYLSMSTTTRRATIDRSRSRPTRLFMPQGYPEARRPPPVQPLGRTRPLPDAAVVLGSWWSGGSGRRISSRRLGKGDRR